MKENLGMLIERYALHCEIQKGLSRHTIKAYRVDLKQFSTFVGNSEIYYSKHQIQTFIAYLKSKYKIKSVKRKIATLKAFFAYLQFEELIENNPFQNICLKLREPFLLPRTIPLVSIDSIFKCIYQQKILYKEDSYKYRTTIRDIAVLELLFATGIRVSELCSIRPSAVGYLEGDRGHSFPKEYAWTQCSFPDGALMLSVADIPLGCLRFTGVIGIVLLHGKEYRLVTYLGAKAVRIENGEIIVRQGHFCLTVKQLDSPGHPLQAPVGGAMTRTIHEHPACKVYYRFEDNGVTLLELEALNAAFEYEY